MKEKCVRLAVWEEKKRSEGTYDLGWKEVQARFQLMMMRCLLRSAQNLREGEDEMSEDTVRFFDF